MLLERREIMEKELMLRLPNKLYNLLLEAGKNENMEIEEYIIKVLEKDDVSSIQMSLLKEIVLKDLQELVVKITKMQEPYSRIPSKNFTIVSMEEYDRDAPVALNNNLDVLKRQEIIDKKNFYLIIDKDKIIGNIGIDFHEEPMPFGSYGYIYYFNIEKSYNHLSDLQRIITFLRERMKNQKVYNLDVLTGSSPLTKEILIKLGFNEFYNTLQVKANIIMDVNDSKVPEYRREIVEFNRNYFRNLLPIGRKLPFNYLVDYWNNHKKDIQLKKIIFSYNNTLIDFIIIEYKNEKEKKYIYSVLLEPIDLFNEKVIQNAYNILMKEIRDTSLTDYFIIDFPEEFRDSLNQYINIISMDHISLYRKFIL